MAGDERVGSLGVGVGRGGINFPRLRDDVFGSKSGAGRKCGGGRKVPGRSVHGSSVSTSRASFGFPSVS